MEFDITGWLRFAAPSRFEVPYNTKTGVTGMEFDITGWLCFATPSRLEVPYNTKTGATPAKLFLVLFLYPFGKQDFVSDGLARFAR